jgi:hypothetical protein
LADTFSGVERGTSSLPRQTRKTSAYPLGDPVNAETIHTQQFGSFFHRISSVRHRFRFCYLFGANGCAKH